MFSAGQSGAGGSPGGPPPGHRPDTKAAAERPVLVVDDDPSIVEMLRSILEAEGYRVLTAANGREALQIVGHVRPALMLLDMRMPVLDGWQVAAALRERGWTVPVVVMTAAENARRWAEEIQADGHIAKPFDLGDLLDCVARHWNRPDRRH